MSTLSLQLAPNSLTSPILHAFNYNILQVMQILIKIDFGGLRKNKEVVSEKQAIYSIALFIVAETFVLSRGMEVKKGFWIAIIFGMLISAPLMLIFAKLLTLK